MIFGNFHFDFRKSCSDFLCKHGYNGIFRCEMSRIDQIQSQIVSIPELVILDIRGDEGIATGTDGIQYLAGAGTAAYSNFSDRLSAVYIAKTFTAKAFLDSCEKVRQRLLCDAAAAQQTRRLCHIHFAQIAPQKDHSQCQHQHFGDQRREP